MHSHKADNKTSDSVGFRGLRLAPPSSEKCMKWERKATGRNLKNRFRVDTHKIRNFWLKKKKVLEYTSLKGL